MKNIKKLVVAGPMVALLGSIPGCASWGDKQKKGTGIGAAAPRGHLCERCLAQGGQGVGQPELTRGRGRPTRASGAGVMTTMFV